MSLTDEQVELFAIRVALGNNGGTWADHYSEEHKEHWRKFVRDLARDVLETAGCYLPYVKGEVMSDWIKAADPVLDFSVRWVKSEGPDKLTLVAENVNSGSTLFQSDVPHVSDASTCHTKKD